MSYENDLISFEEKLHQHGYRVESRVARSFFERSDGNVQVAFDQFVASLSPAPQPVPEWVQLVDPTGRTYYQNNYSQQVPVPSMHSRTASTLSLISFPALADPMGSASRMGPGPSTSSCASSGSRQTASAQRWCS